MITCSLQRRTMQITMHFLCSHIYFQLTPHKKKTSQMRQSDRVVLLTYMLLGRRALGGFSRGFNASLLSQFKCREKPERGVRVLCEATEAQRWSFSLCLSPPLCCVLSALPYLMMGYTGHTQVGCLIPPHALYVSSKVMYWMRKTCVTTDPVLICFGIWKEKKSK